MTGALEAPPEHTGRPEQDAESLLRAVWAPSFPDMPSPVDPVAVAQGLGLIVYEGMLDEEVSGMLVKRAGFDPAIYLNRLDSDNRQRFTCAHELGHYVKRASTDDDEWEYVDKRGPSASRGTDPEEVYANKFAAALLMPRKLVERLVAQGQTVAEMTYRLGVSMEAMKFRLDNLGLQAS